MAVGGGNGAPVLVTRGEALLEVGVGNEKASTAVPGPVPAMDGARPVERLPVLP